jgi:hypothetical protein
LISEKKKKINNFGKTPKSHNRAQLEQVGMPRGTRKKKDDGNSDVDTDADADVGTGPSKCAA